MRGPRAGRRPEPPPGRPRAPRAPRRAAAPSVHRLMGANGTAAAAGQPNVSCTCNCKRSLFQSMEITELEFVQILVIVVVMMVMVVVITCLLSHYKLSARSFISRHGQERRREDGFSSEGCLWPSESTVTGGGIPEPQVYPAPRAAERLAAPPFARRERLHRFQPTYPYVQHEIDLPPTISLSDGEEPPPYQGPCTLQLRDPEQQRELNRESVRAPPNRTVFDRGLRGAGPGGPGGVGGPAGAGAAGRPGGPPPAYSEVMAHYRGAAFPGPRGPALHIAPLESKDDKRPGPPP